jgi:hypothetical protein
MVPTTNVPVFHAKIILIKSFPACTGMSFFPLYVIPRRNVVPCQYVISLVHLLPLSHPVLARRYPVEVCNSLPVCLFSTTAYVAPCQDVIPVVIYCYGILCWYVIPWQYVIMCLFAIFSHYSIICRQRRQVTLHQYDIPCLCAIFSRCIISCQYVVPCKDYFLFVHLLPLRHPVLHGMSPHGWKYVIPYMFAIFSR